MPKVNMSWAFGAAAAALLLMLALLPACSVPPDPVSNNRNEISFRYDKGKTSPSEAERVARDHCASWGKQAVPVERDADQNAEYQRFACR